MRLLTGSLLALIAVAMAQPTQENEQALRVISESVNQFSNNFMKEVGKTKTGNLIASPLSANVVLAMAAAGAGGETETQFKTVLGLPESKQLSNAGYQSLIQSLNNLDKNVTLTLANKIFVGNSLNIKPQFTAETQRVFGSTSESVNFQNAPEAANTINTWVRQETHNRINSLVDASSLDPSTALMLVNAVYFKGLWKHKFNPENTRDLPFHVSNDVVKNVPTMYRQLNVKYGELENLNAKIIELPYQGDEMSMVIVLPNNIGGLPALEQQLSTMSISQLLNQAYNREVRLFLPKFKIESEIDLNTQLQNMGLTAMFTSRADFSGISDAALYVSKVLQKAFIEVNEEGSEAAAVTGIQIMTYSLVIPEELTVDHPFVFSIVKHTKDENGRTLEVTPIFTGRVIEPSVE